MTKTILKTATILVQCIIMIRTRLRMSQNKKIFVVTIQKTFLIFCFKVNSNFRPEFHLIKFSQIIGLFGRFKESRSSVSILKND